MRYYLNSRKKLKDRKSIYNVQNYMTHYNVGLLGILTRVFNLDQIGLTIIASTPSAHN